MTLEEIIKQNYPHITNDDFINNIKIVNDSDEKGEYLSEWNLDIKIPDGIKLKENNGL